MRSGTFQHLQTPGDKKNFDFGLQGGLLGLHVSDGLSLFVLVHLADFDSMGHNHESAAFNSRSASSNSCPCHVLLKECFC
jgi:hypothetical protein